ncbi:Tannase/feruloyl esterase [Leptodontidium sp. 2 PMI_412]|nr:Tannase/feruloyl esterase [Leptodontidium sp. 2 PMI_412]
MRQYLRTTAAAALAAGVNAASNSTLATLCTVSNIQAALPANGTLNGIDLIPSSVTANAIYNGSLSAGFGSTADTNTYNYCNVTVSYAHTGKNDNIVLAYTFPSPDSFTNRFYVGGGGGYALSSSSTGGLAYGAASGFTDAGYDGDYDANVLAGSGSLIYDNMHMFGYKALGEMTTVGKALTQALYSAAAGAKIYTYYEGCSDGGREGWSQVQRWGEEYDGVIVGAPAFRYAQQQINHLTSNVVEKTLGYYPPPCEMDKIVNLTIAACDGLDGRTDGVVSRTDLCKLNFNFNSTIGEPYYCAASTSSSLGFAFGQRKRQADNSTTSTTIPAQNGTVTAEGVAVVQQIMAGLFNSEGKQAYLPWQYASSFEDASTTYDSTTGSFQLDIKSTGGEFVTKFVQLIDIDNLSSLDNITYDTLIEWMNTAMIRYSDTLQTTVPDLTTFKSAGGKIIHYHGESDDSVPPASSIHYYDSVRTTMNPNMGYNESVEALNDWYRLFLVPGAAHCSTNTLQPGPYPQVNMATMINWVENGVEPTTLNATVASGSYAGETQNLCSWPLRPYWSGNNSMECQYDQASIDSWTYTFDAFKLPVY